MTVLPPLSANTPADFASFRAGSECGALRATRRRLRKAGDDDYNPSQGNAPRNSAVIMAIHFIRHLAAVVAGAATVFALRAAAEDATPGLVKQQPASGRA
jgi:hypothetical protein